MTDDLARFALGRFPLEWASPTTCVVVDGAAYPLAEVVAATAPDEHLPVLAPGLFDRWDRLVEVVGGFARAVRAGRRVAVAEVAVHGLRAAAPVEPRQVFQSGANYRSHVIQLRVAHARQQDPTANVGTLSREAAELMDRRAAHGTPYVFLGLPAAICGPYDDVLLPGADGQHDWELELAVVIRARAHHVTPAEAPRYVAGYTICNDLTTRDRVFRPDLPSIGTDWLAGKNAPTFLPTGPYLVPAAFVPRPDRLRLTLKLNGETMQDESTADMIFDIGRLIAHVSAITPLLPGDLLLTGSPAGNGIHHGRLLRAGDVMEASITGLGEQRNHCVPAPTP